MSLTRASTLLGGLAVLALVWLWPLPKLDWPPFTSHMLMHMAVVAVAAPLLSLTFAGSRLDPVLRWPAHCSAIVASALEFAVVWSWHAPALHHLARHHSWALALEQASFLLAGLLLWGCALGGDAELRRQRSVAGIAGLLLTSMHMTLLGALIALAPRILYHHASPAIGFDPLEDQRIGGAVMLFVGAAAYLGGGVALLRDTLLRQPFEEQQP